MKEIKVLELEWAEISNGQSSSERQGSLEDKIMTGLNNRSFFLHFYKPLVFLRPLKFRSASYRFPV